jgi:hypothetical protein
VAVDGCVGVDVGVSVGTDVDVAVAMSVAVAVVVAVGTDVFVGENVGATVSVDGVEQLAKTILGMTSQITKDRTATVFILISL